MRSKKFQPRLKSVRWSKELERELLELWEREGLYKFKYDKGKPLYSIDTPPPYINSPIHIGHAHTYTWMDAIARYKRMKGYNVLFPIGLDRNGLPIEVQAEKEFGIDIRTTPREIFLEKCRELLNRYENVTLGYFRRLGVSFNSWRKEYVVGGLYETDDVEYRRLTQETFIELYNKGMVYEGLKTVNYCPRCRTTISDAEIEYEEFRSKLVYVRFKLKKGGYIVVATTRPELLGACKILLFNPGDDRYRGLEGEEALVPIYGHSVRIKRHPYANPEFGTGLMMVCSFGDYSDIQLLRELGLKPTYLIDEDGRLKEEAGGYKGLSVTEARKRIVEDLGSLGHLERIDEITHRRPVCWRCKTPIEFIASKEIFVKQTEFKELLLSHVEKMSFYSPSSKQILVDWINGIKEDWPVSRRRYYGTEIPLWYCKGCGETIVPPPGRYYQPWREPPPVDKCPKCGSREFEGETRIFDTWFDSSSSAQYILGYLWDKEFFNKNYPVALRPQGKEIVRNWLYFTLLKSVLLYGRPPFKDVWIHMHVVDEHGRKMAKSLGNVIDPREVLEKYGGEAFRAWVFLEGDITESDIRCSYRRIEGHARYLTKLWNISRFISSMPIVDDLDGGELVETDKWVLAELARLVEEVNTLNDRYAFHDSMSMIRGFTWNLFASNYLEMVKPRAYGEEGFTLTEQKSAWFTLHHSLKTLLLLQAPMLPYITDYIWRSLYKEESIHKERYPERIDIADPGYAKHTERILSFNSRVWSEKKRRGIRFSDPIDIEIPNELQPFKKDLVAVHRLLSS